MTRDDLIRSILEKCGTPHDARHPGRPDLVRRSPAAGGGFAHDSPPVSPQRRRHRDPQTGGSSLAPEKRPSRRGRSSQ